MGIRPVVFTKACRMLHQDIGLDCPTLASMAEFILSGRDASEHAELRIFLDDVLSGDFTGGEIKALFRRSPADSYPKDAK